MSFYVRTQDKERIIECKEIRIFKNPNECIVCNENKIVLGYYSTYYKALYVLDQFQKWLNTEEKKCFIMMQDDEKYNLKERYPKCHIANINHSINDNDLDVNRPLQLVEDEVNV